MRKTFVIFLSLTLLSCSAPKPEGLILKVKFQPEKTYRLTTIRGTETVITYSGEDFAMRKLKSMRIINPTISKVRTKTDAEMVTGKSSADSSFRVSLIYQKIMSLDGRNEIPEGTVVQGEIKNNELPSFNKVVTKSLSIDQRIKLLQTVQTVFEQFKFPEQRFKTGDQFSTDRPVSMPMEGSTIAIVVTTNYKLLRIQNDLAEFELSQSYLMTPEMMDNSFTGNGSGKGQLSYDITNCIITDYSLKTELKINKKLDYYEFDLKSINEFSQQTKLVKK